MGIMMLIRAIALVSCLIIRQNKEFKPNKLFDIIYINLNTDLDRNEHMKKMLEYANCSYTRFNAVDGINVLTNKIPVSTYCDDLEIKYDVLLDKYNVRYPKKMREAGYKLSHELNFCKIASLQYTKFVMVLEDNVDLDCGFVTKIEEALLDLPNDWDILILSAEYKRSRPIVKDTKKVIKVDSFKKSIGFLVNGAKSAKNINNLIKLKCVANTPINKFLSDEAKRNIIKTYALKKHVVDKMPSTLQKNLIGTRENVKKVKDSLNKLVNQQ